MHMQVKFLTRVALALILLLGLYLRVGAVLKTEIDTPVRADARLYYLYSLNLQHSGTFSHTFPDLEHPVPDAFAPPLFPLAIIPFLQFPPSDTMVVNIGLAQALLGTLTILFTFLVFQEIVGPPGGLLAAGLTAISPHLISLTTYMLTETLFTFLMMGGLLFAVYMVTQASVRFAILAGLLVGLAALTRSTLEYFPLFLVPALLVPVLRHTDRDHRRNLLILALVAFAVIGAWKVRNFVTLGIVSDPTLAVATLQSGMYPDFMFDGRPESLGIPYRYDPRTSEISSSLSNVLQEIVTRFETNPLLHLEWYLIGKPIALLSWSMIDGWGDIFVYPVIKSPYFSLPLYQETRAGMLLLHPVLMIAGFICSLIVLLRPAWLGLGRNAHVAAAMLALLVAYFLLLHMVGAPFPRYGVPLRPVMYGLAVVFLIACCRRGFEMLKLRRSRPYQQ